MEIPVSKLYTPQELEFSVTGSHGDEKQNTEAVVILNIDFIKGEYSIYPQNEDSAFYFQKSYHHTIMAVTNAIQRATDLGHSLLEGYKEASHD